MMAWEYALFESWTPDCCMHKSLLRKWALAFDNGILYRAPRAITEYECITCAHSIFCWAWQQLCSGFLNVCATL